MHNGQSVQLRDMTDYASGIDFLDGNIIGFRTGRSNVGVGFIRELFHSAMQGYRLIASFLQTTAACPLVPREASADAEDNNCLFYLGLSLSEDRIDGIQMSCYMRPDYISN